MGIISHLKALVLVAVSATCLFASSTNTPPSYESLELSTYSSMDEAIAGNRLNDSLVLVDFYNSTNGDNWFLKWNFSLPISLWAGVTVDATGCVTCIDLDGSGGCSISVGGGNGLTGYLTPRLGELRGLKHLILGNNRISGEIPRELFDLPNIITIDVFANEMIGPLPADIRKADNLSTFSVAGNNFAGSIPAEIGELQNLENLFLDNNQLSGSIPAEIGKATSLKSIRLNNNSLTGPLPATIGDLINLTTINIAENRLSGMIPAEIGKLEKLEELILATNELESSIPEELGNCTALMRLRLCHNYLTGPLPASLGQLGNVEQFWVNDNQLEGNIPPELGACTNMTDLRLQENKFSGSIPEEFEQMEDLRKLNVSINNLTGPLPARINKLSLLQELIFSDNQMTGPLPASIGDLDELKLINGANNLMIGPLPSLIEGMDKLREMNLSNNKIDGNIPEQLGLVPILMNLNLSNNKLSGCFPETLRDKCELQFDFSNNTELPWLGDLSKFCAGEEQVGAKCSTETGLTEETIQADCTCYQETCQTHSLVQDVQLCENESINIEGVEYNQSTQVIESLLNEGGCDSIVTHNIVKLSIDIATENTQCSGQNNGSATVTASINGLFEYQLFDEANNLIESDSGISTLPSFENNLAIGSYRIVIKEENFECNIIKNFSIESENDELPETYLNEIRCEGEALIINGTSYDASNPSGTETFSSASGCDSIVVVNLDYLTLDYNTNNVTCENEETGSISCVTNLTAGTMNYIVLDATGREVINESTVEMQFSTENKLAAGTYALILNSDELGCNYEISFEIIAEHALPEPITEEYSLCPGEIIEINGHQYDEDNPEGSELLTTINGCDSLINVRLSYLQLPLANDDTFTSHEEEGYDILSNDEINENRNITITIVETSFVDNASIDEDYRLIVEIDEDYSGISTITYELCSDDCQDHCVTARAIIASSSDGYDEGILTPNNDGYNDVMVVTGYSEYEVIPNSRINVVNRWGQVVYSTENYSNDWNGNLNDDPSKPLPEGVYYYQLIYDTGTSVMGSRSIIR